MAVRQETSPTEVRSFAPYRGKSYSCWKGKISAFFKTKIIVSLCNREAMAQFKYESDQSGVWNSRVSVTCSY